jgi:hypothetical protein
MWVDHVVPDLVGDVGDLTGYLDVRDLLLDYVADDVLLVDFTHAEAWSPFRFADSGPRG